MDKLFYFLFKAFICISCFIFTGGALPAQAPLLHFQHLDIHSGLSNKTVFAIGQDAYGFVLVGTAKGLNRFDGLNVRPYGSLQNPDIRELNASEITFIQKDSLRNLWIGTDRSGLYCFSHSGSIITRYHSQSKISTQKLSGDNIRRGLGIMSSGSVWIADGNDMLTEIHPGRKIVRQIRVLEEGVKVRYLTALSDSVLLIGTNHHGVFSFNPQTRSVHQWAEKDITNQEVNAFWKDAESGKIWVCSNAGLFRFDYSGRKEIQYTFNPGNPYSIPSNNVTGIIRDKSGRLWIATYGGGISFLNEQQNRFISYQNIISNTESLSGNEALTLFQDESGKIWVGTHKSGLSYFNPESCNFEVINDTPKNRDAPVLSNNNIRRMLVLPGKEVLILNEKNVERYNPETRTVTKYPFPSPEQIGYTLALLKNGKVLFAADKGLFYFESGQYTPLLPPEENAQLRKITAIHEDFQGNLWFGGDDPKGLFVLWKDSGRLNRFDSSQIPDEHINTFFENKNHVFYAGTWIGAFRFDYQSRKFIPEKVGNVSFSVISMLEDAYENLWMGTYLEGLFVLNPKTGKVQALTRKNYIPDNNVISIQQDSENKIWIATDLGLCRLIPEQEAATDSFRFRRYNYNTNNGFPFNQTTGLVQEGETFFAGTLNGLVRFNREDLTEKTENAQTVITKIMITDKEYPVMNQDSIFLTLNYFQNFFSIEYSLLNYENSRNEFSYYLENFNQKWNYTENKQSVSFSNLDGGIYYFYLKARKPDGTWTEARKKITIRVFPPFWKTGWFFLLCISLLLGIVYFIYQNRVSGIRAEEKLKTAYHKEISEMQVRLLRSQMNPHFLFNSLNSINHYIQSNEGDIASDYLVDFAKLMRMILDNSQYAFIPLKVETEMLELYLKLEKMRFSQGFDAEIRMDNALKYTELSIPGMVIQPFVENAIWHGLRHKPEKGKITLTFSLDGKVLTCIVKDNGVGRSKSAELNKNRKKHQSHGQKIAEERLDFLAKEHGLPLGVTITDLTDSEGVASGTQVEIRLPVETDEE